MEDLITPVEDGTAKVMIRAGQNLGAARTNPNPESRAYTLVPEGSRVEYLERDELPYRLRGTAKLFDLASFLHYWTLQSFPDASAIYGSLTPAQFLAVYNDQKVEVENWRDHRGLFALQYSREWVEWSSHSGKPFTGNEAFAHWLEDNLLDIVDPAPAAMMDMALNFRVNQAAAFGNAVRLADGNVNLTYTNTVEAGAGSASSGQIKIPETFSIEIPVWTGIGAPKYRVDARFRYRLAAGVLTLRFELIRPHAVIEQAFKDMVAQIEKATGTTVIFGMPE